MMSLSRRCCGLTWLLQLLNSIGNKTFAIQIWYQVVLHSSRKKNAKIAPHKVRTHRHYDLVQKQMFCGGSQYKYIQQCVCFQDCSLHLHLYLKSTRHNRGLRWNFQREVTSSYVWCCTNVQQSHTERKLLLEEGDVPIFSLTDSVEHNAEMFDSVVRIFFAIFRLTHFSKKCLKAFFGNVGNQ